MAPGTDLLDLNLPDAAATETLGALLAGLVRPGDVIALQGDLGAGKTTLARGLIRTLSGDQALNIPSPTFTLVETYETPRGPLWHFDLYRLAKADEAYELGIEDAFAQGISLIEWPERLGGLLPGQCLTVALSEDGAGRRVTLRAPGPWAERIAHLGRA